MCVHRTVHNCCTQYCTETDLIVFPITLQTITTAPMTSIWGRGSNISSTCPDNMVNFGLLAAEIVSLVWGTPANFNGFRVVVGVSQTAALNRERHLAIFGRAPSRWALAHILVLPTSVLWKCCFGIKDGWPVDTVALKILMVGLVNVAWLELLEAESCSQCCNVDVLLCFYCLVLLEWCKPWPHVTTCHASIRQLLSSCCYLFTVLSSGLLFYT